MKVLTGDQLNTAETVLKAFFPQSLQEGDRFKTICAFSKDEAALRKMLGKKDFLPWQEYFCLGVDQCFELEVWSTAAAHAGVSAEKVCVARQMRLHDLSQLPVLDSNPPMRLSSLDEAHLDLVKGTWKFSEGRDLSRMIRNMICNFPSCCLLDEDGMPVAWILTYPTGAMGLLYTVPEHRGKGCAKILISTLARRLHALGCPVYCNIEEENHVSYQLFTKMGFTEDPCYRAAWFRVYGHIFLMNRMKSDPVDVLVDSWPDFTIVACRPQNKEESDRLKPIYTFSKDEAALRKMLGQKDLLPWQEFFFIGVDQCFELAVRSAAAARAGVSTEKYAMARQMRLHDLSQLPVLDRPKKHGDVM
ncbi:hypothetical protein GJAV_G00243970 [Gymnothorax javanicus]|nr:hypothetical protein GJAV_G00243970 [Gymnothorax javanicus]